MMKPRLQTSMGQQLVLTPQLRQALHLLQLPAIELEAELAAAIESNPLLDWVEPDSAQPNENESPTPGSESTDSVAEQHDSELKGAEPHNAEEHSAEWDGDDHWRDDASYNGSGRGTGDSDQDSAAERVAKSDTLQDHLSWQLHLSPLSTRDRRIGSALIDAIDDDGYCRESLETIGVAIQPEVVATTDEILTVLRHIQNFDPLGVAARNLGECLALQLKPLSNDTPGKACALRMATGPIERLPKIGVEGMARELDCGADEVAIALQLLRTLYPRPGGQIGKMPDDTYITPDCTIYRQKGVWRVSLANGPQTRLTIHRGYEQMIGNAAATDAGYLRGRLQEARWLLKNLEARGDTLLKVVSCLVRQQSGFLEFGAQALRPLTLREVATEVGLHESTVSRAISRKHVHTPRGTIPLRNFFASGIDSEGGGETSSIAIQTMIKRLIEAENPRKPLSDARLAESLKASGVPVARRTVAKYREAMNIPSSHERVTVA